MKGRNLLSGFLAAIITVLVVVSLADGYANPDPEPPKVIAWDPDPGTVTEVELEKGIKCRFDKPVDNPEDLKIRVTADGHYLKGWKVNWLDDCTAIFTPGEISYNTGFVLESVDKFGNTYERSCHWGGSKVLIMMCSPGEMVSVGYDVDIGDVVAERAVLRLGIEPIGENEWLVVDCCFDRALISCTPTVTDPATGKSFSIPAEQVDENTFRLSIPPLQANTKVLLELYLTDKDGNHGYCALAITTQEDDEEE